MTNKGHQKNSGNIHAPQVEILDTPWTEPTNKLIVSIMQNFIFV